MQRVIQRPPVLASHPMSTTDTDCQNRRPRGRLRGSQPQLRLISFTDDIFEPCTALIRSAGCRFSSLIIACDDRLKPEWKSPQKKGGKSHATISRILRVENFPTVNILWLVARLYHDRCKRLFDNNCPDAVRSAQIPYANESFRMDVLGATWTRLRLARYLPIHA